ncbi:MAG: PAS domain S-box protein, partial [Dehalococcoidales bacterium]|nr:PAS domain S-box protein [Dehalococcoidales bacterium]
KIYTDMHGEQRTTMIIRDITERKQAEHDILASEIRYRRLFEAAKDGILILDAQTGQIIDVNPYLVEMLGVTRDHFLGKQLWELGFFKDIFANKANLLELQKKKYIRYADLPLQTSDGRRFDVEFVSNVYDVDNTTIIQCNIRNITERKKAEEAIKQSEEQYRTLFETMTSGVAVYQAVDNGDDFIITHFNKAAEQIEHIQRRQVIGKKVTRVFPGVRRFGLLDVFSQVWRTGQPAYLEPTLYSDDRDKGSWRENWVYKQPTGEIVAVYNDVTARQRAEEILRHSQQITQSTLDSLSAHICLVDENGIILAVNSAWRQFAAANGGVAGQTNEGANYFTVIEKTLGEDNVTASRFLTGIKDVLSGGISSFEMEYPCHSPNEKRWFSGRVTPYIEPGSNTRRIVIAHENITQRVLVEDALKKSEANFRNSIAQSPMGVLISKAAGETIYMNRALLDMYGFKDINEFNDTPREQRLSPLSYQENLQRRAQALRGERPPDEYQLEIIRKDGSRHTLLAFRKRVTWDGEPHYMVSYIDITESKKASEAMKESEERFRSIFDLSPIGAAIVGLDYKFRRVNQSFSQMIGYTDEEMSAFTFRDITHPDDLTADNEQIERLNQDEIKQYVTDKRYLRKDGRVVWGHLSVTVVRDPAGQPLFYLPMIVDITARKETEKLLSESEVRFRSLYENLPTGIVIHNADGEMVAANPAALKIVDVPQTQIRNTAAIDEFFTFFREDGTQYPAGEHPSIRALKTGRPVFDEVMGFYAQSDKDYRWLYVNAIPQFRAGESKPFQVIVTLDEFTARKKTEKLLQLSETNFRNTLDTSPLGVRIVSAAGETLYANRTILDIYGYANLEQFSAVPTRDRYTEDSYRDHQVRKELRLQGAPIPGEYQISIVRTDGAVRHLQVFRKEVIWNGQVQFQVLYQDITASIDAQVNLARSEARFRELADMLPQSIWETDINGILTYSNAESIKTYGVAPDRNRPVSFLDVTVPEQRERAREDFRQILAGRTLMGTEYSHTKQDGTIFPVLIYAGPIMIENKIIGMRGITVDISERKRMQEQMIATDRLASIGELASGVAHELNNPLTSIIGFSELLLDKEIPADIKDDINLIHREAERTANIVKNLLTFARRHKEERRLSDLNSIIKLVLDMRAHEHKVRNIKVHTDLSPDLPRIMVDEFQIQQVFFNIIINAEYFMTETNGRGNLTISTRLVNDKVRVTVHDDGPGISPTAIGHIFDPFYTTKDVGKGTGLGLSICHGIVTAHQGSIRVESEPGKGSTFYVELPVNPNPPEKAKVFIEER